MRPIPFLRGGYRDAVLNLLSRVAALAALALATLVVARSGGPEAVGVYVLLRVLPSLLGVVLTSGLPGAVTYFLAGEQRTDRRLPLTIVAIALTGGSAGALLWTAGAPILGTVLFPGLSLTLVFVSGVLVLTRVGVATAKACSQGRDDLPGANRVIVTEELMFLPAYGVAFGFGAHGFGAVVVGLLLANLATLFLAWSRLVRRGFFHDIRRPSRRLARTIALYGLRAQVGSVMSLLNLRLDFIILSVLTGPGVLGVYAIASKFAELAKVPGRSMAYVLYPRYAKAGRVAAIPRAKRLILRGGLLTGASVAPLWLAASFVIPAIYGSAFQPAVLPAQIILLGLVTNGAGSVITAFLYGIGRPGLNSLALGAGLVVTIVLDFVLIPPFGATGAAIASAVAYTVSSLVLLWFFSSQSRTASTDGVPAALSPEVRQA